ncbi:MAG TPA: iron-containing redox enzyme family protein [Trichormus sp.]|jgi:pyrroloquinoline quinone (PQQ) biosynthesis protein C
MTASISSGTSAASERHRHATLADQALQHRCARHQFFSYLQTCNISTMQAAALLRNYDAHATVLRRLLLKAAAIMPETAVGYVLENVRNEYGNGNARNRHQLQLKQLACAAGVTPAQFNRVKIEDGVRAYLHQIVRYYCPLKTALPAQFCRPAVAAGAITATEILALEEFRAMQKAFHHLGLAHHIWFDHVNVEAEHLDESLALAVHFIENYDAQDAVEFGMHKVLEANCDLYDGLLNALTSTQSA